RIGHAEDYAAGDPPAGVPVRLRRRAHSRRVRALIDPHPRLLPAVVALRRGTGAARHRSGRLLSQPLPRARPAPVGDGARMSGGAAALATMRGVPWLASLGED